MLEYTIYYRQTNRMATIYFADLYQIKKRYAMLTGYQANDEELLRFSKDFKIWINEIKENDIFTYDKIFITSNGLC